MTRLAFADTAPDPTKVRLGARADPRLQRTGLSDQIGFALRIAQTAVWADLVETLAPFSLRPQQYAALLIVGANDGCKQRDIAAALGIQRPNVVVLVDELATRGLVRRDIAPGDRRSYALSLSARGTALLSRVDPAHRRHLDRIHAAIGISDTASFMAGLERLAEIGA